MKTIAVFTGVPSFFRCRCQEAQQGGGCGYRQVGELLASHLCRLIPLDLGYHEWIAEVDKLEDLLSDGRIAEAEAWVTVRFPRCLALVPARRRAAFFRGLIEEMERLFGLR